MNYSIAKYYDPAEDLTYEADSCLPLRLASEKSELELTALARGSYPGKVLRSGELEGVKSVGYWNIKKLQNWGLDWHTNEGIEICFLENGHLDFMLKESTISLQTNDITITRPWMVHKLGNPCVELSKLHWLILDVNVRHPHQNWEWPEWIILNCDDLEELTLKLRQNEQAVLKAGREFRNCFIEIGRIIKYEEDRRYDSRLKVKINNLLVLLLEILREGNIVLDQSLIEKERSVKLFLQSLDARINESWSVVRMADFCHIGVTRFTHYCNEITNCSPMEYLNRLRLRKAAGLLTGSPDLPVIDVAFICGFASPQYFSYAFRKHFNCPPGLYRRLNRITK